MALNKIKNQLLNNQPLFIGEESAFQSAVLIPLVKRNNEWHVLFEVRSFTMRKQPGDISFPGGKIDKTDASPELAAIRETYEELNVPIEKIEIVGKLSPYIASPSFVIYPFVGVFDYEDVAIKTKDEVETVFTVPLDWLLTYEPYVHTIEVQPQPPSDFPYDKIMNGEKYEWRARSMEEWFYDYEGYTIWGMTGRILKYFIDLMKN